MLPNLGSVILPHFRVILLMQTLVSFLGSVSSDSCLIPQARDRDVLEADLYVRCFMVFRSIAPLITSQLIHTPLSLSPLLWSIDSVTIPLNHISKINVGVLGNYTQ